MSSRLTSVSKELQLAAIAAIALAVSMVLPWYQKSVPQGGKIVQGNVSALGVFTFVEAAVLLVAFAVLFLVWARSQKKGFHLPGGDGVAITIAGGWAVLLLIWRMFDRPEVHGVGVDLGIQWGLFVALICAGGLVVAGARVRALGAPEPPNPAAEEDGWVAVPPRGERDRRPERRPRDATAVTEMLRDRPAWEGDAPSPEEERTGRSRGASEERTTRLPDPSEDRTTRLPDSADERTTRLPDRSEDRTTRLPDPSDERTTRLPDSSEERTTRLPDPSDDRTSRLFDDPSRPDSSEARTRRQRRPADHPPLWEEDPPR
jgi:hypothetical protein